MNVVVMSLLNMCRN